MTVCMRITIAAVGVLLIHATPSSADFSVGGSFAAPGYGARAWGKGGAAIASGADEEAVYWNPAMLALLGESRVGLSYANIVPGTDSRQSYVAYAQILKRGPTDEPGLEFAEHAIGAIYGNLTLELSDGQSYSENTLRLSYAYTPLYFLSFGVSFAALLSSSDVESFGSDGSSLDASVRLGLLRNMTAAVVFRNIISQVNFNDGVSLSLPRAYTLGIAYRVMENLVVEGDIEAQFGDFSNFVLGGEYSIYHDVLALRGGVAATTVGLNRTIGYVGVGVQVRRFQIDYAVNFDSEEAFENTQRFALGIGF